MGQESVEQLIKKLINKVQPYGWTPSFFNELKQLSRQTDPNALNTYISSRLHANTSGAAAYKEEHIILIILWNMLQQRDTHTVSALIHRHLRDRLIGQDVNFGVHALLGDHIPLPRSLVYDITERLLLNIEVMYAKIVNDFRKVPASNTDKVILFLTLHYCRKDLNTQNKEMIGLILAHIQADVPAELLEDVKEFLTNTFLQEIQISGHRVQIDENLYSELNRRSQAAKEKKQEKPDKSREVKSPWEQMKNDMAKSSSDRRADKQKQSDNRIIENQQRSLKDNSPKESQTSSISPTPRTTEPTGEPSLEEEDEEANKPSESDKDSDHPQEESPGTAPEHESSYPSDSKNERQYPEGNKKKVPDSPVEREPVSRTLSEMEEQNLQQDESSPTSAGSSLSQRIEQTEQPSEPPSHFIPADRSHRSEADEITTGDRTFHFTYETPSENVEGIYLKSLDYQVITSDKSSSEESGQDSAPEPPAEDEAQEVAEAPEKIAEEMAEDTPEEPLEEEAPSTTAAASVAENEQQDAAKRKRKGRVSLLAGLAVLLLAGGTALLFLTTSSAPEAERGPTPAEQTEQPAQPGAQLEETEPAAGENQPADSGQADTGPNTAPTEAETSSAEAAPPEESPTAGIEGAVPADAERLELSSGDERYTFYLQNDQILWQPAEGDYFYKLFTFLQDYQGSGPQSVTDIGNLTWLRFLNLLRELNPEIGQLDLIYPEGIYAINRR